jgi:uncharacterized protein (DUF1697 family)
VAKVGGFGKRRKRGKGEGMADWVALMRGINVGATRKLPMADLRALCGELGWHDPQTYIQSGNLIFGAEGEADDLRVALEEAIEARFGLVVPVVLRPANRWAGYAGSNPFADDAAALPKLVHLYLSRDPLKDGAGETLKARALPHERVRQVEDMMWIDYGDGVADSKMTPAFIDKSCGSPVTGRNWNSVLKIADMIAARA